MNLYAVNDVCFFSLIQTSLYMKRLYGRICMSLLTRNIIMVCQRLMVAPTNCNEVKFMKIKNINYDDLSEYLDNVDEHGEDPEF